MTAILARACDEKVPASGQDREPHCEAPRWRTTVMARFQNRLIVGDHFFRKTKG